MDTVLPIYKKPGETPLECLHRLRVEYPQYADATLSYAGRLDPLADGVLLVLVGDANKEREQYIALPKTYLIEILFGINTDTHDILGKVHSVTPSPSLSKKQVEDTAQKQHGAFEHPYPLFSSKTVDGTPLFELARKGKLEGATIPTSNGFIDSIETIGFSSISSNELLDQVRTRVQGVNGDFRQDEIIALWEDTLKNTASTFPIYTCRVRCKSGTYMRTLAHVLGVILGTGALALRITRESVGPYAIKNTTQ